MYPNFVVAKYIDQLNNHKRLKQIVAWVIPDKKQFYKIKDDIPSPPQRNRRNNSHSKSYNTDKDLEDETNNSDEADTPEDDLHYPEDRYYTYNLKANLHDCEESEDEDDNESEYDKDDKEEYPEFKLVDKYVNQNPKWRDHVIDLLSLHPDSLQKILETEQKLGRFKPRDLTQEPRQQQSVWRQSLAVGAMSRRSYQQQQPHSVHEQPPQQQQQSIPKQTEQQQEKKQPIHEQHQQQQQQSTYKQTKQQQEKEQSLKEGEQLQALKPTILLQKGTVHSGFNKNTKDDQKTGKNKTEVEIGRWYEQNKIASVDKTSNTDPSKIKTNPRIEKFFTADQLDKVEYHHKPRSNNKNGSCVEPRLSVLADRISMGNPSQMKINPTLNPKNNKTDEKASSAAHINLDDISGTHYKDDRKSTETRTPSPKIKNTPGLSKIHQDDKFTTDGSLKISMMKNKPRLNLSNEDEKFSADEETLKTSNRELKVDKPSGNNDPIPATEMKTSQTKNNSRSNLQEKFDSKRGKVKPETDVEESSNYLDNIKAQQILNRLETDDNRRLLIPADKSILSDDFISLQVICKQINQIQSGSVRETTVRTSKFKMKSLNNNWSFIKLTPTQTRDNKKSKPIYTTDRLNPKITQTIISQPQDSESEEFQTWTNFESNYQRDAREIESDLVKKSVKVDKSKPNKRSKDSDIKSLELLSQSYTEISSSSDEEERKEYRIARSKVHLRPGRLKRPG